MKLAYFRIFVKFIIAAIMLMISVKLNAQGLINNGASVEVGSGAFIYIDGGANGNFVNQDFGAAIGIVENQGTIDVTGDWTNNSVNNVFNSSLGTVRLLGANQDILGTTSTYFNNLTLLGSGTKTLNIATLCGGGFAGPNGVLDLTTLPLDLNGYKLTINNPGVTAITNTSGYIISETPLATNPSIVQWNMGATNGVFDFPFGVAGVQIPFTFNKVAGIGNVAVSTRATAISDNLPWESSVTNMYSTVVPGAGEVPVVIDRWWDVDPTAPVTAGMSFTYRGTENTTTYNPTGTFSAQNWNGVQWLPPVGAGPGVLSGTSAVTIPSQVITSTPWVLANLEAPLPVELLSFDANCYGKNRIQLKWTTASEKNNAFFTLEKSADGIHYIFLTKVPTKGNNSALQEYAYADPAIHAEKCFYRLSQTDLNGSTEYFKPITSTLCADVNPYFIHAWSNGFEIYIAGNAEVNRNYMATVFDAAGRQITTKDLHFFPGPAEAQLSLRGVAQGIYFLYLKSQTENVFFKLLIGN